MNVDSIISRRISDPHHFIGALKRSKAEQKTSGSGISSLISNTQGSVTDFVKSSFSIAKPIATFIFGLGGLVGGGLLASFIKDNTSADWGAKILMIAGTIMSAFGVKDLLKINKKQKEEINKTEPESTCEKLSETFSDKCRLAERALLSSDPTLLKVENPLIENGLLAKNNAKTIRQQVVALLSTYTDPELKVWINNYASGNKPSLINISRQAIGREKLRDRVAILLGNAVSSRKDDSELPVKFFEKILDKSFSQMVLSAPPDATPDIKEAAEVVNILPDDFSFVFNFARYYADSHRDNNNSLNAIIGDDKDLRLLQNLVSNPVQGPTKDSVELYINRIQNAINYFNVLNHVIKYVLDNAESTDETINRNVVVLRQALICGLRLKGDNSNEIDKQLREVKFGVEKSNGVCNGLEYKLQQLEAQYAKMDPVIKNEKFPFAFEQTAVDEIPFLQGLTILESSEKN